MREKEIIIRKLMMLERNMKELYIAIEEAAKKHDDRNFLSEEIRAYSWKKFEDKCNKIFSEMGIE